LRHYNTKTGTLHDSSKNVLLSLTLRLVAIRWLLLGKQMVVGSLLPLSPALAAIAALIEAIDITV
jgi:hypothetical protein